MVVVVGDEVVDSGIGLAEVRFRHVLVSLWRGVLGEFADLKGDGVADG